MPLRDKIFVIEEPLFSFPKHRHCTGCMEVLKGRFVVGVVVVVVVVGQLCIYFIFVCLFSFTGSPDNAGLQA